MKKKWTDERCDGTLELALIREGSGYLGSDNGYPGVAIAGKDMLVSAHARPHLQGLAGGLALVLFWFQVLPICLLGAEVTPVEAFKEFLGRPPVIREISFMQVRCGDSKAPQHFAGAIKGTNFFLREHLAGEDVYTPLSPTNQMRVPYFVGAAGQRRWEIAELTVWESEEPTDVLFHRAEHGIGILETGLVFGLPSVKPGSLIWDGNRFTAVRSGPIPVGGANAIHGVITVTNGVPVRLDSDDAGLTVYYDYSDGSLPLGVPNRATLCLRGKAKPDCLMVTEILRLDVDPGLPEEYFEPYWHIAPKYLGVNRSVAGRQIAVKDNTYAVSLARVKQLDRRNPGTRLVIICAFILVSASFAGLVAYRSLRGAKRKGRAYH